MKRLIIINGVMGVGKTTVCKQLYRKLDKAVWLDGDWCWMMDPFVVNETTKTMVIENSTYQLNNFIKSDMFENIIFNWVIDEESIYQELLSRLSGKYSVYKITLLCNKEILQQRIEKDIEAGIRDVGALDRSLEKLTKYQRLSSIKIDTSHSNIEQTIDKIIAILG